MIDLTGPLTRARLTLLLGGRPFDLARIKGVGVVLSIRHEFKDSVVDMPIEANDLDPSNHERMRTKLATMVRALDNDVFPDRQRRFAEATHQVRDHMRAVAAEFRL